MKLTIPFKEFEERINSLVAEGELLHKDKLYTEEELAKSKGELKDWKNRSYEFLKTAFGESNNYLINEFRSAGGNRFSFPGMRTDLDHRIREHSEIFKETVSELSYCLMLASVCDPIVEGDRYSSIGRDSYSQDEKILFFLRKLNQINTGGYHPIKYLFESNDVRLNHHDELRELAMILNSNGVIELHPGLGTFHAKITATGVHTLQQIEREILKSENPAPAPTAVNIVHVQNMVNSSFQQGTSHSTLQNQVHIQQNIEELKSFLNELKQSIETLNISAEIKAELESEIATAEAQAKHPKPRAGAIKETLSSIRKVFEGVSINMIPKLIEKLPELIDKF